MSTRWDDPADAMIDGLADPEGADVLADAVEAHLDRFPLPVDEDAVARVVDRLEERLGGRRAPAMRWLPSAAVVAGLVAAAAALFVVARSSERGAIDAPVASPDDLAPLVAPAPPPVVTPLPMTRTFPTAQRTVHVEGDARWVGGESGEVAAILAQEGDVRVDETVVREGHWALITRDAAGVAHEVVFPDGTPPPPLPAETWADQPVDPLLEDLRWKSLPDETLSTLDRFLEAP